MSCEHGSNSILGVSWNDRIVSVLLEISLPLFGIILGGYLAGRTGLLADTAAPS